MILQRSYENVVDRQSSQSHSEKFPQVPRHQYQQIQKVEEREDGFVGKSQADKLSGLGKSELGNDSSSTSALPKCNAPLRKPSQALDSTPKSREIPAFICSPWEEGTQTEPLLKIPNTSSIGGGLLVPQEPLTSASALVVERARIIPPEHFINIKQIVKFQLRQRRYGISYEEWPTEVKTRLIATAAIVIAAVPLCVALAPLFHVGSVFISLTPSSSNVVVVSEKEAEAKKENDEIKAQEWLKEIFGDGPTKNNNKVDYLLPPGPTKYPASDLLHPSHLVLITETNYETCKPLIVALEKNGVLVKSSEGAYRIVNSSAPKIEASFSSLRRAKHVLGFFEENKVIQLIQALDFLAPTLRIHDDLFVRSGKAPTACRKAIGAAAKKKEVPTAEMVHEINLLTTELTDLPRSYVQATLRLANQVARAESVFQPDLYPVDGANNKQQFITSST